MMNWDQIFDHFGVKKASKTDKGKNAYVLADSQVEALKAANIEPAQGGPGTPLTVKILFDSSREEAEASFYYSLRSPEEDREPEPRLGKEIVSKWMEIGDEIIIGNIGEEVLAAKLSSFEMAGPELASEIASKVDPETILARAANAKGKPGKALTQRTEFVRNAFVVAGAIVRAGGLCEMPGCTTALFKRDDGTVFLEVHHIIPLAEGGDDELANAAALCPMCHRELHFGASRIAKRATLAATIALVKPPLSP